MCLLSLGYKSISPSFPSLFLFVFLSLSLCFSVSISISGHLPLESSHCFTRKPRSHGEPCVDAPVNSPTTVSASINCKTQEWSRLQLIRATFFKFQPRPQITCSRDVLTPLCPVSLSDSQKLKDDKWWWCFWGVICYVAIDNQYIDKIRLDKGEPLYCTLNQQVNSEFRVKKLQRGSNSLDFSYKYKRNWRLSCVWGEQEMVRGSVLASVEWRCPYYYD